MITLDKTKQPKIHTRKITVSTYEGTPGRLIIEGVLEDERLFETYRFTGAKFPAGTIHHMIIRLEVSAMELEILDAEIEMPTVPNEGCVETLACMAPLKGMSIAAGFSSKIRAMAGGPKGCCHLLALLKAMAPTAVQGAWCALAREPIDLDVYLPLALTRLQDTCWMWREDGPLMELLHQIDDQRRS